jgi:hypothetical protein
MVSGWTRTNVIGGKPRQPRWTVQEPISTGTQRTLDRVRRFRRSVNWFGRFDLLIGLGVSGGSGWLSNQRDNTERHQN